MAEGLGPVALLILAVNVVAFAAFGWDKLQARRDGWRLSERFLLTLATSGGILGAKLGQRYFRHKTTKQPFARRLNGAAWASLFVVVAVLVLWLNEGGASAF